MPSERFSKAPYGIDAYHCDVARFARFRTPLAIVLFIVVLGSALFGFLGGGGSRTVAYVSPFARVVVEHEPILRSGNWFETTLTITPSRNIEDLVMAVDQPLWRGMSIDTIAPDAESAEGLDGTYSYHFGPVKSGETLRIKFDGQIQPRAFRRLRGDITIADDKEDLMAIPVSITVLP
jgi:hypothetical protein